MQGLRKGRQTEGQGKGGFPGKACFHGFLTWEAEPLPCNLTAKVEGHVVTLKAGLQPRHGLESKVSFPGLAILLQKRFPGSRRRGEGDTGV